VPVTGDDGGTDATGEVPADRLPVRCSDRFAAPAVSAGLGFFNLSAKFFGAGTEQHSTQFFYLCPQMLYLALFVLYFLFCAGQCRTQERLSLCNETELTVFLAKRLPAQRYGRDSRDS
jgi:hypothetical protein